MRENAEKRWTRITPNKDTFYAVTADPKEEILKVQDNFLTYTTHASSNKVGEKVFFKKNENKLVNILFRRNL